MIKKIARAFQRIIADTKESIVANAIVKSTYGQVQWTPKEFKAFVDEGYKDNVYVYRCINIIAKNFADVPWYLYQKAQTKNGKPEAIEDHDLLTLFNQPNPNMGGTRFREDLIQYLMLSGNSYIERVGGINLPPEELYILRPDRMNIVPGNSIGMVKEYQYIVDSFIQPIGPEYIKHLFLLDPENDWYGMSPLVAASKSLDQNNSSRTWNVEMLQNNCVSPGVLSTDKGLTDVQYERLENRWRDKYMLAGDKYLEGTPMIMEGGLKWDPIGTSPRDMQYLEGIELSAREIAIAYGVAPELLGDSSNKTYSNYKEARKALYEEVVIPLLDWVRGEVNGWLTPLYGSDGLYLEPDLDSIEVLQEEKSAVWDRIDKAVYLTIDEKRAAVGYGPHPDPEVGKIVLVPAKTTTLDLAMSQASLESPPGPDEDDSQEPEDMDLQKAWKYLRSGKSLRTKAESGLGLHIAAIELRREPFETAAIAMLEKHFADEGDKVADLVMLGGNGESVVANNEKNLKKLIYGIYLATSEAFAGDVVEATKDLKYEIKADEGWKTPARDATLDWLENNAGDKIKDISETTKEAIREELAAGTRAGESITMLAKRIEGLYLNQIVKGRSELIARTEVIAASNLGGRAGVKSLGLEAEKTWLATPGARTRAHHASASGQKRGIDEPYTVMGEQLLFPGDTSLGASAKNVCRCRCTEVYEIIEE